MSLTHEQIDRLEGRELDEAFAEAFPSPGRVAIVPDLAAFVTLLPSAWRLDVRRNAAGDECTAVVAIAENRVSEIAFGPTPATALCRAAIKAKLAEEIKA